MTAEAPTIILIDDDSQLRFLTKEYLELEGGYRVVTAANGQEGWNLLSEVHPSLVVCDVMMPLMDGFEFVQKLRQNPRLRSVPLIFLSAKGDVGDRIVGLNAGGDVYLVKPFEPEELLAQIRSSLARLGWATQGESPAQFPPDTYLTPTERRVLRLVAQGLTNQQVADELNVSRRTVESHVSNMLNKIGLGNRTELARWAMNYMGA
ncbi:two component LuxR family transcriptional regulator [Gloeomargarita lithophora Alchichica-D10]|uniref:Two component LuxR family transcriptional regulator n=1 Tax=Gloeomargarita lithophora Alchichica-D10 TaxID=1188229 RepID=A0A1J0AGZ6_9CYAN|nr:response regulator transcription factor [Gloeomargarita lithophora]APB35191.1 two component LuxR family transcriptional regulator [Gloeomargarita lithophora Alchichica-D10]